MGPRVWRRFAAGAVLAVLATGGAAQEMRTERVSLAPETGRATMRGSIAGDGSVSYALGAEAGQRLDLALEATNGATYFNLYAPGRGPGDEALANGGLSAPANRVSAELESSGEYTISVYMMRSAARRGEVSDYTLDVALSGTAGETVAGDFADGLQGGPDWWRVRTEGDKLRLRAEPSTAAAVRGWIAGGARLRNAGGCRMAEGRRWCAVVSAEGGASGWVAGDFLVEASAPEETAEEEAPAESRVSLAAGESRRLDGRLRPGGAADYTVSLEAGARLTAELEQKAPGTHLNVDAPDGTRLYGSRATEGAARFSEAVAAAGDYVVTVYHLGAEPAPFALRLERE